MACNCISQLKAKLAETNTVPISVIVYPQGDERLTLRTERIMVRRDRKQPTPVICAYCPVCGTRY